MDEKTRQRQKAILESEKIATNGDIMAPYFTTSHSLPYQNENESLIPMGRMKATVTNEFRTLSETIQGRNLAKLEATKTAPEQN